MIPKKTKEERIIDKLHRKSIKKADSEIKSKLKKKLKSKLQLKKDRPNSSYWRDKADKLFMEQGHGKPCVICGTTEGTCFHHHVAKSTCKALRYDLNNNFELCVNHHNFSNEIAAHSTNAYAQLKYMEFIKNKFPERYDYCEKNQHSKARLTYKEAYEHFLALKKQGKPIEMVVV